MVLAEVLALAEWRGGLRECEGVGEVEVGVAVVVDWVFVEDALQLVLVEGEVVARPLLDPALDRLRVLERTQPTVFRRTTI